MTEYVGWDDMASIQNAMAHQVVDHDAMPISDVATIAGFDVTWFESGSGIAGMAILSYPDLRLIRFESAQVESSVDYCNGFLGFREVPSFVKLFERVKGTEHEPDVLMVDGHGVLHPRRCGSASHLGVLLQKPTIGVGKKINNAACINTGKEIMASTSLSSPLLDKNGDVVGRSFRHTLASKSVYVSVGHLISLDTAFSIVSHCCKFKNPEPVRFADMMTKSISMTQFPLEYDRFKYEQTMENHYAQYR